MCGGIGSGSTTGSGNSGTEWRGGAVDSDVQRSHGLTSCSEWTGVAVATLLRECGVRRVGSVVHEGSMAACRPVTTHL